MFGQCLFLYALLCYLWIGYMYLFNVKTKEDFRVYNTTFSEKFWVFILSPILLPIELIARIFKPGAM